MTVVGWQEEVKRLACKMMTHVPFVTKSLNLLIICLVGCLFAREIWYHVLLRLRWHSGLTPSRHYCANLAEWCVCSRNARSHQKLTASALILNLVILTSLMIWIERNRTFNNNQLFLIQQEGFETLLVIYIKKTPKRVHLTGYRRKEKKTHSKLTAKLMILAIVQCSENIFSLLYG